MMPPPPPMAPKQPKTLPSKKVTLPAEPAPPAPAKAGELPAGFFDDKNADLKARGVDPEKAKAESEAKAWAEFSEFAGGVARDEAQDEAIEDQENDDESRRRALDQA